MIHAQKMGRVTIMPGFRFVCGWLAFAAALACAGCGGGGGSGSHTPPPPVGDFTFSMTPGHLSVIAGAQTSPVSMSITALNGFSGSVTVALSGLPSGATTQPSGPFMLAAGATQAFAIAVPASAPQGVSSIQAAASSGSLHHSAQIALAVNPALTPIITRFDDGTALVLQTQTASEIVRVGLLKAWGAAITEVSLNGVDYVNNDDPGRQIQTSLWDEDADYINSWGYNPIESGDHFFEGSPVLNSAFLPDGSIYTKTRPIQWAPENFGGGPGSPVAGDADIEKWVSVVPGFNRVFNVHYKITHFGTDTHTNKFQELPVMYVNPNVPDFSYYGGAQPWTNDVLSQHVMSTNCCDIVPTTELWGAYVDSGNVGIALYTPQQFPVSKGFNAFSTLQFTPFCPYTWYPGTVLEFDTYILVGPVSESRAAIYALHDQQTTPSTLTPLGWLDNVLNGTVSGTINISGFSWALPGMKNVDVFVDGNRVGSADYGLSRPDIPVSFPGAPSGTGFSYMLDTTTLPNGSHTILVKLTDNNGNVATYATQHVTINN
jgi:hypothetical protein